jgi:preprotein translocase subunit SecD
VNYRTLAIEGNAVVVELIEITQTTTAQDVLRKLNTDFVLTSEGLKQRLVMNDQAMSRRRQTIIDQSIEVVRRRVDETGVAEPAIQQQGTDRIVVELPGIGDPDRVKRLLGQTAKLNFHMVDEVTPISDALAGQVPPGSMLLYQTERGRQEPILVRREVDVSGERLVDAQPAFQDGQPIVSFRFDAQGGRRFGDLTTANVNKRLAIVLDNKVISAPSIRSPIVGGSGIITGGFSVQEANDLALLLRAGALPAPLLVLEALSDPASARIQSPPANWPRSSAW